ncbi:MAG: hypothetical protein K1V75_01940 [Muribaculaceae bacterium]
MASEKIYIDSLNNTFWEISSPSFVTNKFTLEFTCMGNKWVGDFERLHKDLYPSRYEQTKFIAIFLNDRYNLYIYDSDIITLNHSKFELFFRAIDNFIFSVEAIPGGFGFQFYPHPISFNIPKRTSIGKVRFLGCDFRIAEKTIIIRYIDWETEEKKSFKINLSAPELNSLKRIICSSILYYMRNKKRFGWSFEFSPEIKKSFPFFEY